MRKSYRQLDDEQRSVLVAMLDCERSPSIDDLERARSRFQVPRRPIQEAISLLKEGFLQESAHPWTGMQTEDRVDWIHPSYRDLVIEELERDALASEHFLLNCSWVGLQLTLSIAGGDKGQRRYPLMTTDKAWSILQERLISRLKDTTSEYEIREILQAVRGSLEGTHAIGNVRNRIAIIIKACCDSLRNRLDRGQIQLNDRILKEYYDLTMSITPPPPMPDMHGMWSEVQRNFEAMLGNAEGETLTEEVLSRWIEVIQIVLKSDRRLLLQDGFPEKYDELIQKLCEAVTAEADATISYPDDDVMSSEADRFAGISMNLDEFALHFPHLKDELRSASHDVHLRSARLKEAARGARDRDQPSWVKQRSTTAAEAIDLDRLFSDL
jgi:hypothetical protein